ncbi:MAG: hypothetical protein ACKVUS_05585 [Saprospiraceae bacterium]
MEREHIQSYIAPRRALFWSVGKSRTHEISDPLLVETILNFGTQEDVHELFRVLGLKRVAEVFFEATRGRSRHNYFPQVENFFRLYFERYAR